MNYEPIQFKAIGVIHTPYTHWAPNQPIERDEEGDNFVVDLDPKLVQGLEDLDRFNYVILVYHLNRQKGEVSMSVTPSWAKDRSAGLFATRTPNRPNPIGISIVRLKKIEGHRIYTSPLDVFDGTPLLDIKPYIAGLDSKDDANLGWIDDLKGVQHLMEHVRGIPHDHGGHDHSRGGHAHDPGHDHGHGHSHEHIHTHTHDHEHDGEHSHGHDGEGEHSHEHTHTHCHEHEHGGEHNHKHD